MQQSGGGTNDKLAFENAQAIFNTDNRNASQCIVFLTDGDCAGSVQIASKLRDEVSAYSLYLCIKSHTY